VAIPFERPIVEPLEDRWGIAVWRPRSAGLSELRLSARRSLFAAAREAVAELSRLSGSCGLQLPAADLAEGVPETQPVLLTGHQPVIFHPGLVYKYQLTQAKAAASGCLAAAIVIDTDEGDAGAFPVPQTVSAAVSGAIPGRFEARTETLSAGSGLYTSCRLALRAAREAVAGRVQHALESAGCPEAASAFSRAASMYCRLPELPMWSANTLVRRMSGIGSRMAELPLTSVCALPEVLRFFANLVSRAQEFHAVYNQVLNVYRLQQGIRNEANPFPNLRSSGAAIELPFWLLEPAAGRRSVVWLHLGGQRVMLGTESQPMTELSPGCEAEALLMLRFQGQLLVPRGALITATLRLLFGDLFIHGLGGGRYDPATDQLIREWWQEEPPPFAVASASSCLFPCERDEVRRLQDFRSQFRDLQFNPGRYLDQPYFSLSGVEELRQMLADKQSAVDELQRSRSAGVSGRETGRRIQQLSDAIRSRVTALLEPQLRAAEELSEETIRTVESRTWPWFYFDTDWVVQAGPHPTAR
jgi:hypothetical protein